MIRADMDALPMEELGDCPYRSQNKGVAHMCGHDAHTAALIGAARILSQLRDEFPGTVKLCFQPAEEAATGGAQALGMAQGSYRGDQTATRGELASMLCRLLER